MVLLSLIVWLCVGSKKRSIIITPTAKLLFISLVLLAIPLFYTRQEWLEAASWRWAGLLGGLIFYFSWLQVSASFHLRQVVYYGLLFAISVQALLALLQLFAPELSWVAFRASRVYGIFQQPNVLASFIATGLALALMLFLLPGFALRRARYEHCRLAVLGILLLVLPALLVWIQSRVGWLGGTLVTLLFLWRFYAVFPVRCKQALMLIAAGAATGIAVMLLADVVGHGEELRYLSHEGSNQARWTMLRDTLRMIAAKPWLGWGYGGFEYSFLHFRINQIPPTVVTEIANHPHNEILLWWVEGGLVALLGMGLIIAGGLRLVCRAWRQDRQAFADGRRCAGEPTALCFVLLPIVLHTQLEYPFYLSALHFMVFLLLLAMLDCQVSGEAGRKPLPAVMGRVLRGGLSLLSLGTVVVMAFALQGGLTLTRAERTGLADITAVRAMPGLSAWVHQDRKGFDEQVHALLMFNRTGDERLLEGYVHWANGYLKKRIDRNVYASLYLILKHQGNNTQAERLRREAIAFFPDDPRFM
ncbi:Wzy polymerase domain-containing protein [Serratia sp. PAMC26656]|uniref:PglL family O-oligosaccharyltransferase n=1 Tax=Serratia sp. PAMC26656 TaxID=2775909 RepID=UPI001F2E68B0|nr:O-antigen ligase family protein [Serratia sp. PAMC26656]